MPPTTSFPVSAWERTTARLSLQPRAMRRCCARPTILARRLQSAAAANLVLTEGTGRKANPFRYWLPSAEARWRADPLYEFHQMMDAARKPWVDGG